MPESDYWLVVIGRWHFGPLAYGGREWPLWGADEQDRLSRQPAVSAALAAAAPGETTPAEPAHEWPPLEACDCGDAQQNHGWACRCSDPPSKRAAPGETEQTP